MQKYWLILLPLFAACGGTTPPPQSVATALVIQAGENQQAVVNTATPIALAVKAVGSGGEAIAGVSVTFTLSAGSGTLEHANAVTAANGIASAGRWTLGAVPGTMTMTASAAGLPSLTLHAVATAPATVATDTTIGPGGGVIVIDTPGEVGHGFKITIPASGFPSATHVVVAIDTARTIPLPPGVTKAGPVYQISGFPATQAGAFLRVTLPVTRPDNIALAAFMRDPLTGRLELLSAVDRSADGFTVVSRHLSTGLMFNRTNASGAQAAAASSGPNLEILLLEATEAKIMNGTNSGFVPGVDDWEFTNYGSYIAPGGHCEGQSLTAIWYYMRRKPTDGKLFNHFNEVDQIWMENRAGYRFASMVQESINFDVQFDYIRVMRSLATVGTFSRDRLFYDAAALAMLVTSEPQIAAIWTADEKSGHAIVVYRTDQTHMYVADPNFPGVVRSIDYNGNTFSPFSASDNARTTAKQYTQIAVVGMSNAIDLNVVDALWSKVLDKTIGAGKFPAYTLRYYDLLAETWFDLLDTLTTRQETIRLRAVCTTCGGGLLDLSGTAPHYVQWLQATDDEGSIIGGPVSVAGATADGIDILLDKGSNKIGNWVTGKTAGEDWGYLDWHWVTISALPFGLTPSSSHIAPNDTLHFSAKPSGSFPAQTRYVWNFDDGGAPVTVLNDSTINHKFTTVGVRNVSVEMWDHTANRKLARAVAVVEVADSIVTWTIDSLWGATPPAWSTTDVQTTSDYAKLGLFFAQLRTNPGNGKITYLEPPANPDGASIKLTQSPDASNTNSLILALRITVCQTVDTLIWTGTTSNGSVIGKGRTNFCLIGAGPGLQTFASIPRIEAIALGNILTGTVSIDYTDFDRVNNYHIPKASLTVVYSFRAHR